MSESVLSSLTPSLEALPHNTLVIDRYGSIQFVSSNWKAFSKEYHLPLRNEWSGIHCLDLLQELVSDLHAMVHLRDPLQSILLGKSLVFSTEFAARSTNKGSRILRLDAFPLMVDLTPVIDSHIISFTDIGPVSITPKSPHKLKLIPICAACKSIRDDKEEWLRIEHFLQQKLSMQFTHDICPNCIRQLYPKYAGVLKYD